MGWPVETTTMLEKLNPSTIRRVALFEILAKDGRPHHASHKTLPLVQIGKPVLEFAIFGIERIVSPIEGTAIPGYLTAIGGLAEGIVGREFQAVAHGPAKGEHQRVDVAVARQDRASGIDTAGIERNRERALSDSGDVGDVIALCRRGRRDVAVHEYGQPQAAAENVARREAHVPRQLALEGHFALVYQRVDPVRRLAARSLRQRGRIEGHYVRRQRTRERSHRSRSRRGENQVGEGERRAGGGVAVEGLLEASVLHAV